MTEDKATFLLIKGSIADLPKPDQEAIERVAAQLREIIALHPGHAMLAFALVGAELQMEC